MQPVGVSNLNRLLPPCLFNPTLPKISPAIHEQIGGKDIWRMPQHLPTSAILPLIKEDISLPVENPDMQRIEKQAARMIVIRRRKMKKHKLRKLRKVRKFEYRRMALKRKTLKEKEFQMKLMAQVKDAEKFEAKFYVEEMIRIAKKDLVEKRKPHPAFKRNPSLYDEDGNRILLNQHLYGRK